MRIILASKSGVRKKILDDNNIESDVIVSNVDEDEVKISLQAEGATPVIISKNLAEIKSVKVVISKARNNFRMGSSGSSNRRTSVSKYSSISRSCALVDGIVS